MCEGKDDQKCSSKASVGFPQARQCSNGIALCNTVDYIYTGPGVKSHLLKNRKIHARTEIKPFDVIM